MCQISEIIGLKMTHHQILDTFLGQFPKNNQPPVSDLKGTQF